MNFDNFGRRLACGDFDNGSFNVNPFGLLLLNGLVPSQRSPSGGANFFTDYFALVGSDVCTNSRFAGCNHQSGMASFLDYWDP